MGGVKKEHQVQKEDKKNLENDEKVKEHQKKEATTYEKPEIQKAIQGAKKEVEIQGEDETSEVQKAVQDVKKEVQKAVQDVKKEFKVQREDGKKDEKGNEHQVKELTTYGTPEVQKTEQDVKKEVEEVQKEVQREVRAVREAVHSAVQERKIQNVRGWRVQNGRRQQSHENEKNLENDEVKEHRKKEATTYETPEVQKTIQGAKKEVEVQREDETSEVQKAVHDVQKEVRKEHGKKDDKGNEHPMKELTTYGTPEVQKAVHDVKKEKLQKEVQKEVQRKVRAVREVVHSASQREIQHVRGERVQDRTGQQTHEIRLNETLLCLLLLNLFEQKLLLLNRSTEIPLKNMVSK